ncbi:hypothetical protein MNEG_12293 [Monoraphidium neglectum]|uniref:Uncharacterized protein n=1 Tax=Monoraphidium neglectum TaxID=145388 RepID=A0A0D2KIS7_9CHLO|nr:hypothetical protein MNEG_12293 [Monoraphidium neglectum]KIY95668.1 hypothetical protein MNEG_12293 [Monoraphidium neglectum]|eukprot:XP_013894688.1 hypothetical protein MNEG_12293 [Monoraphidium neglectum]
MAAIKEQVVGPPSRPGEAAAAAAAAAPAGEGEVFGEGGMGGYAASDGGAAGAARGKGMGRRSDEEDVFADAASELTTSRPGSVEGGVTPNEAMMATAKESGEVLRQHPFPADRPPVPASGAVRAM